MSANPGRATNEPGNYFAIARQTAKSTDPSQAYYFAKHLDGSGFEVDVQFDSVREGGDGQEVGLRYKKLVTSDGQLIAYGRNALALRMWYGILGSEAVATGGAASLQRHTLIPVASLPYFYVEQFHGAFLERSTDNMITSVKVEGEAGQPWKYTAAFVCGGSVGSLPVASAQTPIRETAKPAFYPNGCYLLNGAASYATDITKWSVEVTRGVDDAIQTTALTRDDVVALNMDVNVDLTVKLTSAALYQDIQYNASNLISTFATGSLDLTQVVSAATGIASAIQRIVCPQIEWVDAKVNKLDPDGKTVYVDLVGMGYKGATSQIFAVVDSTSISPNW